MFFFFVKILKRKKTPTDLKIYFLETNILKEICSLGRFKQIPRAIHNPKPDKDKQQNKST